MLCVNLEGLGRRFKRMGTYVSLWLIHAIVWQKPTQHCKESILQFKKKLGKNTASPDSEKYWLILVASG